MPLMTPTFRRGAGLARRWPLIWQARELSLDALTDQAGVLTRAATGSSLDSNGVSRTGNYYQPRWYGLDLNGDTVRESTGLFLSGTENLKWVMPLPVVAMCGLIDFVENNTIGTTNGIFALSNATPTAPLLIVASNGTQYYVQHNNASSTVTATMTGTAPTTGQRVRLRWWLYSDGKVQIWQSINGAAETGPAASATLALGAAWSTTTAVYLNSKGDSAYGSSVFLGVALGLGNQSQASLLQALAA